MAEHPSFGQVDYAPGPAGAEDLDLCALGAEGPLGSAPLKSPVADYYLTNPIARASVVMAECSALRARAARPALAAE
jgi:NADH-quinone oxidoreductase subunit G